jgi:PAS domain S-box-containing protein
VCHQDSDYTVNENIQESNDDCQRKLDRALVDLARNADLWSGNLETAMQAITSTSAEVLDVERCSLWLFSQDRQQIRCLDLFTLSDRKHRPGPVLSAKDYPQYFEALRTERTIAAHDAHEDHRTSEFSEKYLRPLGITSMLDTPVRLNGVDTGVLCHEQTGPKRIWTSTEQTFAGSVGDFAAHALGKVDLWISQRMLASAQELAQVGSWTWDLSANTIIWTDEMYRVYGHSVGAFAPNFNIVMEQVPAEDKHRLEQAFENLRVHGVPYRIQHRAVLPNGEMRTLDCAGQAAQLNDEGGPALLFGTCHDVTSLVQARARAQAHEDAIAYFQTLFEQAPHFIITCDTDLTITNINRTVASVRRDEVIGSHISGFAAPSHEETVEEVRKKILATGENQNFELCALADDGGWAWYEAHMAPIKHGTEIHGFIFFAVDVTEVRQLRNDLARAKTLEAIGKLAAGFAHDFNNVTMAIKGYGDLALKAARRGDNVIPALERLNRSIRRAEALTSQIPTLENNAPVWSKMVDLNQLLAGFVEFVTPVLGSTITISFKPFPGALRVEADPNHLERILLNLSMNARQAMPNGGHVSLELTHEGRLPCHESANPPNPDAGAYAIIHMKDTGIGMTSSVKEQIFDPFFSTQTGNSGTGLGLFTSLNLVKEHGGFFCVESTPGHGAEFQVFLPLAAQSRKDEASS